MEIAKSREKKRLTGEEVREKSDTGSEFQEAPNVKKEGLSSEEIIRFPKRGPVICWEKEGGNKQN